MKDLSPKPCAERCSALRSGCLSVCLETDQALHLLFRHSPCPAKFLGKSCGLTVLTSADCSSIILDSLWTTSLILFCCPRTRCLRVAFVSRSRRVMAYLSYEELPWKSPDADTLKSLLQTESLRTPTCLNHCSLWLDDWTQEIPKPAHPFDKLNLLDYVSDCDRVNVRYSNQELSFETSLNPSFVDLDREILRISDRTQEHIVYADMTRVDFAYQNSSLTISS